MIKISVVIPVINEKYAHNLLDTLAENTQLPSKIVIIDNTENNFTVNRPITDKIPVQTIVNMPRLRVNASWKQGFEQTKDADIVSVLNDDIILSKYFFEKVALTFKYYPDAAVVCPYTRVPESISGSRCRSGTEHFPSTSSSRHNTAMPMLFRQGWAYSIKRKDLDDIPEIPNELALFCGDDWLFLWCLNNGKRWYHMLDNKCFHYVGISVQNIPDRKKTCIAEKSFLVNRLQKDPKFNKDLLRYLRGGHIDVQPRQSI